MIRWAGRLIVLVGAGHLLIALALYARPHLGAWFSGALWGEDLAAMSNAGAALWLTIDSFGVPLILVGLTILWLDRRGLTPPSFIGWTVGAWAVIEAVIFGPSPSWLLPVAAGLLLAGARRAKRRDSQERQRGRLLRPRPGPVLRESGLREVPRLWGHQQEDGYRAPRSG